MSRENMILLPNLPPGCTTVYDAAMELTGHLARHEDLGFGKPNGATWKHIRDYLRAMRQKDGTKITWSLFCDLWEQVNARKIIPVLPEFCEDGVTLDPFRTLILLSDAQMVACKRASPCVPPAEWPKRPAEDKRPMREREHISFAEIADARAISPGDTMPDESRRAGAFVQLLAYFQNGGFEMAGKSVVVARANSRENERPAFTWNDFEQSRRVGGSDHEFLMKLYGQLEIPRSSALTWFQAHGLPLPPLWFPEAGNPPTQVRQVASPSTLIQATEATIRETIKAIYDHADRWRMKPPNISELPKVVDDILRIAGKRAGRTMVRKFDPDFADRRRKQGHRLNSSLAVFTLENWEKSGLQN